MPNEEAKVNLHYMSGAGYVRIWERIQNIHIPPTPQEISQCGRWVSAF